MKQGFMLIELIVASLVASMVAAILLVALAQSGRFQMIVDNLVDSSVRIGVVSHQLEKDLMGAFIPNQSKEKDKKSEKKSAESAVDKKEQKIIEKIFYSTNKNGQFDTLTFITNNPLVVYVGKDVGVVKPKVVRVQYTLKPEADKKNSYALFRQESMELDLEQYKNVTAYELIGGIKSCTMTFTARIPKQQDKQQSSEQNPIKVLYEYKTQNDWVSEQKKESEKEKPEFPRIPYSVEMKMILWDLQERKEKECTIVCHIPTDFAEPQENTKEPEKPKKDDKKDNKSAEDTAQQQPQVAHNQHNNVEVIMLVDGVEKKVILPEEMVSKFFTRNNA